MVAPIEDDELLEVVLPKNSSRLHAIKYLWLQSRPHELEIMYVCCLNMPKILYVALFRTMGRGFK